MTTKDFRVALGIFGGPIALLAAAEMLSFSTSALVIASGLIGVGSYFLIRPHPIIRPWLQRTFPGFHLRVPPFRRNVL